MRSITPEDLHQLGDERFEALVAALIARQHPGAEHLGGKDGGVDILLERDGEGPKGWQVKNYFYRGIHWDKCVESLDAAVTKHGASEVVFVLPRKKSYETKKTFRRRLRDRYPDVRVTWLAGPEMIAQLRDDPELTDEFFGPDLHQLPRQVAEEIQPMFDRLQSALTVGSPDADADDLLLARKAGVDDPLFATEISVSAGGTPRASWDETPYIVASATDPDGERRIAAWPREGVEVAAPGIVFGPNEQGQQARESVRDQLARSGEAVLGDGARLRLAMPKAVETAMPMPEDGVTGTIRSSSSHPIVLRVEVDGAPVERQIEVVGMPPAVESEAGAEMRSFGRIEGGLAFFFDLRLSPPDKVEAQFAVSFSPDDDYGSTAEAARIMLALSEAGATVEAPGLLPDGPQAMPPEVVNATGRDKERLATAALLFSALATVERRLGVHLALPAEASVQEIRRLGAIANALDGEEVTATLRDLITEVDVNEFDGFVSELGAPSRAQLPMSETVFGQRLDLGVAEISIPRPDLITPQQPRNGRREVKISWPSGVVVPFRLIDEAVETAETGSGLLWTPE